MGGHCSNDVSFHRMGQGTSHTMVILEACITAVHPHVHMIMLETMCEYTAFINKNHAVQEGGVTVVPCHQASSDTQPVGFLLFQSAFKPVLRVWCLQLLSAPSRRFVFYGM